MATTPGQATTAEPMRIILRDVPWAAYAALRAAPANDHIRMTYLDGTLELMSPEFLHEKGAERLAMLVRAVARSSGSTYQGAGSTTFRRRRRKPLKGHGREADMSFYFGAHAEQVAPKAVEPRPPLLDVEGGLEPGDLLAEQDDAVQPERAVDLERLAVGPAADADPG